MQGQIRFVESGIFMDDIEEFFPFRGFGQVGDTDRPFAEAQTPRVESAEFTEVGGPDEKDVVYKKEHLR